MKQCIHRIDCITSGKFSSKQLELKLISYRIIALNFVFILLQLIVFINEMYNSKFDEKLIPLAVSIIFLASINFILLKGLLRLTEVFALIASVLC